MEVNELFVAFNKTVHDEAAADWDRTGPQIIFPDEKVSKVLTTLEVLPCVVHEAIQKGCQVILSHHPLFFTGIEVLDMSKARDAMILKIMNHRISVYSAHTNYDKASGGTTDYLTKQLALSGIADIPGTDGFARMGSLKTITKLDEFVRYACKVTETPYSQARFVGDKNALVSKIGICAGSGSEFAFQATEHGCDAFLTGDVKYHTAQDCVLAGINIVDIGHYHSEKHFATAAAVLYGKHSGNIDFIPSEIDINPFSVL